MFKKEIENYPNYVDNTGFYSSDNQAKVITKAKNGVICEQYKFYSDLTSEEKAAIVNSEELENVKKHFPNAKIYLAKVVNDQDGNNLRTYLKTFEIPDCEVTYEYDHVFEFLANMDLDFTEENTHHYQLYDWFDDKNAKLNQANFKKIANALLDNFSLDELTENFNHDLLLYDSSVNEFDGIQLNYGALFIKIDVSYNGDSVVFLGLRNLDIANDLIHPNMNKEFTDGSLSDQIKACRQFIVESEMF